MNEYLEKLNRDTQNNKYKQIEEYGHINNVPIITYDSLMALKMCIKLKNVKKILEIGTAIAYSALEMSEVSSDIIIDTIERNEEMYQIAVNNVKSFSKENQVRLHFDDALLIDLNKLDSDYDMIFIDAAKAQYQKFFERFVPLLKEDGIIVTDNILFHGCVEDSDSLSKNLRNMVKKIDNYNHYLSKLDDFDTVYLDIGDGLAVTMRK